jgi:hypothetical protein
MVGAGVLTYREINKKDYGILTPSRDERYRNAMQHCYQPEMLLEEVRIFNEYGLKAQATMLKRRAEWRGRAPELKTAHEEVYQKALKSTNIPAILEVAQAFEGWTATKKASTLRERVRVLQEAMLQEIAQKAADDAVKCDPWKSPKGESKDQAAEATEVIDTAEVIGDDT